MAACLGFVGDTPILIHAIKLLCTSQIIPKSRVVHLADKQILKRYILSYPKIIISKIPQGGEGFRYLAHGLSSPPSVPLPVLRTPRHLSALMPPSFASLPPP